MNRDFATRSTFWDDVKGICIIAVVVIHILAPLTAAPSFSMEWLNGTLLSQPVDFAVPIFLAISGYFVSHQRSDHATNFYSKRLKRLIFPYVVWTVIYTVLFAPSKLLSPVYLASAIASGTGIGIGYFVIVLLQFTLLTPVLAYIRTERQHFIIMMVSACFGLVWSYAVRFVPQFGSLGTFPYDALPFFVWCPFYQLGLFLRRFPSRAEALGGWKALLSGLLLLLLLLSIVEAWAFGASVHPDFGASQLKLSTFAFSTVLFLLLVALSNSSPSLFGVSALAWLGRNSFPIYLSHMLMLRVLSAFLAKSPLGHLGMVTNVPILTAAVLAACTVAISVIRRFSPARIRVALSV